MSIQLRFCINALCTCTRSSCSERQVSWWKHVKCLFTLHHKSNLRRSPAHWETCLIENVASRSIRAVKISSSWKKDLFHIIRDSIEHSFLSSFCASFKCLSLRYSFSRFAGSRRNERTRHIDLSYLRWKLCIIWLCMITGHKTYYRRRNNFFSWLVCQIVLQWIYMLLECDFPWFAVALFMLDEKL